MHLLDERASTPVVGKSKWTFLFLIAAFEGFAALFILASLPADAENAQLLGYSASRLALMALQLGLALGCAGLVWWSLQPERSIWLEQLRAGTRIGSLLFLLLPFGAFLSALPPAILVSLYRTGGDFRYIAYAERLTPSFLWGLLVCLQFWGLLAWRGGFSWSALREQCPVFRAGLVGGAAAALLVFFVAVTGIGITPDRISWGKPTVPLLEWQVWLAWTAGSLLLYFLMRRRWPARADAVMAVAIWAAALGLWLSQPVRPTFFATAGRLPNNEIYPFSDGAYYGLFAQNVLIGNGFKGDEIPARPMYVTLLAIFHAIAGQDYEPVVAVQTLLLACFPVVLYFLGKELHSRPAGLVMALLAIFRELTAVIALPFTRNASNSKLLFADLPTTLAISLWALIAILWLKSPSRRTLLPLLVGGSLGLVMLFRTQSIILLPGVLILGLLALRGRWRMWLAASLLAGAGMLMTLFPWLLRNMLVTGHLVFDDVRSQTGAMASRYSLYGGDGYFQMQPGESFGDFSQRANREIMTFTLANPGVVARFIAGHWLNSEIANLQVLPLRGGLADWREVLVPIFPFWQEWDSTPSSGQVLLLLMHLGLVVLGVSAAWARAGYAGLVPLLINLSYNGSSALARFSGGRYLLPGDWAAYTYAAIALMEIAFSAALILGVSPSRLAAVFTRQKGDGRPFPPFQLQRRRVLAGCLFFLLFGSLPVLAELVVPRRYPVQAQAEVAAKIVAAQAVQDGGVDRQSLERFLLQPNTRVLKGRALYPRFYAAGDGEPETAKVGYEPLPYARTLFLLASNSFNGLVMVKSDNPPQYLPNASDVLVAGCITGGHFEAQVVLVVGPQESLFSAGGVLPERCPPAAP